jgi:hypothetical protein
VANGITSTIDSRVREPGRYKMTGRQLSAVALGNSNNLAWSILLSLALNESFRCQVFYIDKSKMRDVPPCSSPLVTVESIQWDVFARWGFRLDVSGLLRYISHVDLVIVSGEFIAFASEIRRAFGSRVKIVGLAIGFDIETLYLQGLTSSDPQRRALGTLMKAGFAACDVVACNDNVPESIQQGLDRVGKWRTRPWIWRHINVIRSTVIKYILDSTPVSGESSLTALGLGDVLPRCIFLASRICADDGFSLSGKGSRELMEWLVANAAFLRSRSIGVVAIKRDNVSDQFIRQLRERTIGARLDVYDVPELPYPVFLRYLRHALFSIDSFDERQLLRAHMTTSDALAVEARVVTSFGEVDQSALDAIHNDARGLIFTPAGALAFIESNEIPVPVHTCGRIFSLSDVNEARYIKELAVAGNL